jgi:hypothetical protein
LLWALASAHALSGASGGAPRRRARYGLAAAGVIAALLAAPAGAGATGDAAHAHKKPSAAAELNADGSLPDKIVEAGRQTAVADVWDCDLPNYAPVVSARVEHGSVAISTGNGPNCGHPLMSLTKILYTSAPGFKGTDRLHVLGFLTHGHIDETFSILVK